MMKRLSLLAMYLPLMAFAAPNTADLSWTAPTYSDPLALSYGIYQGIKGAAVKTRVGTTTPGALTYSVTSGLSTGVEACFNVTAIAPDGKESGYSNEACKTFPWDLPGAPVGLTAN